MGRFVIEFGMGVDLHGQNYTKAAKKALKDCMAHACLVGMKEVAQAKSDEIRLEVYIACPKPEKIDTAVLQAEIPYKNVEFKLQAGGMSFPGMIVESLGDTDDSIVIVNAGIVVHIDKK